MLVRSELMAEKKISDATHEEGVRWRFVPHTINPCRQPTANAERVAPAILSMFSDTY